MVSNPYTKQQLDAFLNKAVKVFPTMHRDDRADKMRIFRKKVHGRSFAKLDKALFDHQERTVSKGSLMLRFAALRLQGYSSKEVESKLRGEVQEQAKALNERYRGVLIYKPITPKVADGIVSRAMKAVDTKFLEAFNEEAEMSREYLRKWLGEATVKVHRGVAGTFAKKIIDTISAASLETNLKIGIGTISGFTTDEQYAEQFDGVVLSKKIPIDKIAYAFDFRDGGIPLPGYAGEHEVLVPGEVVDTYKVSDIKVRT